MEYKVVRNTDHPVVKQYMDILFEAANLAGASAENVPFKQKHNKNSVIVVDSALIALYYMVRGYRNIAVWMQGIMPEESFLKNHSRIRYSVLSIIEKITLHWAKVVFVVSEEMQRHYEKKYHIHLDGKTFVMPCFNERSVYSDVKDNLITGNVTKFVYIGSLSEWQCFEETACVFAAIERENGKAVHLTVLTGEQEKAQRILEKHGVVNFTIDCVKPEEVASRISSMKYGFVLRHNIDINRVATPTKLSNYLAAGIMPIYSTCLRGFHQMNQDAKVGVPCDIDDINEAARIIIESMKQPYNRTKHIEKCVHVFDTYYNFDGYVKKISDFMRRVKWH